MQHHKPFIHRLQSIRGLAALTVAATHTLSKVSFPENLHRWKTAVMNIIYGAGAVLVFFILSGFVLGLTLDRLSVYDWRACARFIKRRFLRLVPALFCSTLMYFAFYRFTVAQGLGPSNRMTGPMSPSLSELLRNLSLYSISFNGSTWSLRPEFLFSLLLPITFFWARGSSILCFGILGVLVVIYSLLPPSLFHVDYTSTPYYFLFVMYGGAMVAFWRKSISHIYSVLPKNVLYTLVLTALVICGTTAHFGHHFALFGVAATFLISVVALDALRSLFNFLDLKVLIYLGDISYSFYLLHPLALMVCELFIFSRLPSDLVQNHPWLCSLGLGAVSIAFALPISTLLYYLCERPFTSVAKRQDPSIRVGPIASPSA